MTKRFDPQIFMATTSEPSLTPFSGQIHLKSYSHFCYSKAVCLFSFVCVPSDWLKNAL